MREIPPKIATLLKSRSMIGENKPGREVIVGGIDYNGSIIKSFDIAEGSGAGWRFSDSTLFITDSGGNHVRQYTNDGAVVDSWVLVNEGYGCEIDGDDEDILWVSCGSNKIDKYRISTKSRIISGSGIGCNGIAAPPGEYIWVGSGNNLVKLIKSNGAIVELYPLGFEASGVAWDGRLVWVGGYAPTIKGLNPVTKQFVKSFNGSVSEYHGLTYDGEYLWATVNNKAYQFSKDSSGIEVKSIKINRNKNMAGSLTLTINNKNGEWSPDNTVHQNILFPNKEITVKQGYGINLIQTFVGLIDRIEMSTFPQELKLSIRDKLKLALDQTISGENTHTLVYENQAIETIFTDLCSKAGLATGTIEATGLNITKTFSWETYADCFSFLSDLVGFEFGADEEGLIYFRKDTVPLTPTVAYTFKEGEDVISLGYTIDDNDIYTKVVVYGKDENDNVLFAQKEYVSKDYYNVLSQKFMKIDVSEASTVEQLQAIADRAEMLMRSRVRIVSFAAIAVPWLQIGDVVEVIESSTTISEKYRITDLSTSMDNSGYTMQITCYHHSA